MDHLERRLRAERPSPPQDLLEGIVSRVSRPAAERHAGLRRLGLAALAGTVMITILGAFGGVGFAASGVSGAAASTVNAVSTLVSPDTKPAPTASSTGSNQGNGNNGNGNGNGNGNDDECEDDDDNGASEDEYCDDRVIICHVASSGQQITLTLPSRAAARHLSNHPNDYPGPCQNGNGD